MVSKSNVLPKVHIIKNKIYNWFSMAINSQNAGIDSFGNIYLTDPSTNLVYKINPCGQMELCRNCEEVGEGPITKIEKNNLLHDPLARANQYFFFNKQAGKLYRALNKRENILEKAFSEKILSGEFERLKIKRVFYYHDINHKIVVLDSQTSEMLSL